MTDVAGMAEKDLAIRPRLGRRIWNWTQVILIILIVACAADAGFRLRRWTWDFTEPIRFRSDIQRNLYWGTEAATSGYLNLYERQKDQEPSARLWLDYAPIRLAVMWGWGAWVKAHYANTRWQPTWEFHRPVLYTNMAVEAFNALGIFLLVRLWIIRHKRPEWKHDPFGWFSARWWRGTDAPSLRAARAEPLLGCWRGLAAVLIGWFAPGILMSAYGWPTYDSWIVPAYVWAVLLASSERWFMAGLAVGIGAMAKGQILVVSPVFILWPLMLGRWRAPLRWVVGLLTGIATLASPWMFTYPPKGNLYVPRVTDWAAIGWVCGVVGSALVALAVAWLLNRLKRRWLMWLVGCATAAAIGTAVLWPLYRENVRYTAMVAAEVLGVLAIVLGCWILPARGRLYAVPAAWGTALLLCVALFHGSWCWAECGWGYGMKHWPEMTVGHASNLPGMLEGAWGIHQIKATLFTVPAKALIWWPGKTGFAVDWKILLNSLFVVALVLSALGMARQARRGNVWFLAAQATPWLVFFCLPVQIHERYLLFGAGVAFAAMGASAGMALLAYVLSGIAMVMTVSTAMEQGSGWLMGRDFSRTFGANFEQFVSTGYPHMAWAVLAITGVFLWSSLVSHGSASNGGIPQLMAKMRDGRP